VLGALAAGALGHGGEIWQLLTLDQEASLIDPGRLVGAHDGHVRHRI
jgi:hypothetical protein